MYNVPVHTCTCPYLPYPPLHFPCPHLYLLTPVRPCLCLCLSTPAPARTCPIHPCTFPARTCTCSLLSCPPMPVPAHTCTCPYLPYPPLYFPCAHLYRLTPVLHLATSVPAHTCICPCLYRRARVAVCFCPVHPCLYLPCRCTPRSAPRSCSCARAPPLPVSVPAHTCPVRPPYLPCS
jgi:hypothetical protein